jgi:hypothetical protein
MLAEESRVDIEFAHILEKLDAEVNLARMSN